MKNCMDCRYAAWDKTAAARLHPSGDGKCTYDYEIPVLPASRYWIGRDPNPSGGFINRRKELNDHCAYYCRVDGK